MKFYKYNYFADYSHHYGEMWANDKYDVQRHIVYINSNATAIDIWVI